MNLKLREEQALALTDQKRNELEEAGDDTHPFLHAEQGPNRYQSITWFFPEEDGVRVEEDLDLGNRKVIYFDLHGFEQELKSGPVYDWAINRYEND